MALLYQAIIGIRAEWLFSLKSFDCPDDRWKKLKDIAKSVGTK